MDDVIIIGAGPAGVSASLYTARAKLKTLILYNNLGQLEKARKIENYYGFANGISGNDLSSMGIRQAENLGVDIRKEEVLKIQINEKNYDVITTNGIYSAPIIILALGANKATLPIKGISELNGKGVSYCAVCDGFFYKDSDVAVLGESEYALSETQELLSVVKSVTILTNGKPAPEIRLKHVNVITKPVEEIYGKERVEKVIFKDKTELQVKGIFIAEGVARASDFARKLGIILYKGNIKVNEKMETNIKGIYACGDCTGGQLQIAKAVYEGMVAGLEAIKYYRSDIKKTILG